MELNNFKSTVAGGALVFSTTLMIFLLSGVRQNADSGYSMLLSQSLLQHQSFALDNYALPRLSPKQRAGYVSNGDIYQLELVGGSLYYYFPPGSSVLSAPYVAVMNAAGISAASPDGSYDAEGESKIEKTLAALLAAGLSGIVFFTGRLLLPFGWSLLVAYGAALGTQVWSTASRALWSDTWGVFILGLVVWELASVETKRRRPRPVLLATLLSWLYFVRPTYSVPIAAITVYVFVYHRAQFIRYAVTGAAWLAAFVVYSQYHFGRPLPSYYQAGRLRFDTFWLALAGNLISPSRGLLVFVPVLFFVAYLLIRYRDRVALPRLLAVGLCVVVAHLLLISGFDHWHGGHCYGPRLSTGVVPWLSLLGIIALGARLQGRGVEASRGRGLRPGVEWTLGALLLLGSMAINGRGAMAPQTWRWNVTPVNVDEKPERVWDWGDPQFLAE